MGWKIDGGDPCGEAWKGIACEGSAVVSMYEILKYQYIVTCFFLEFLWFRELMVSVIVILISKISGLGLNGTMGYQLSNLVSLREL